MSSNKIPPDLINKTINQLLLLSPGNDLATFTKQLVDTIKTNLDFYFVAIFLLDKGKNELRFSAGSGLAGEELAKHEMRMPTNSPYIAGTILDGDISLVSYSSHEISRYKICEAGKEKLQCRMSEAIVLPSPLLPDTSCQLFLPIRNQEAISGVLELNSSYEFDIERDDFLSLQKVANAIAMKLDLDN